LVVQVTANRFGVGFDVLDVCCQGFICQPMPMKEATYGNQLGLYIEREVQEKQVIAKIEFRCTVACCKLKPRLVCGTG